MRDINFFSSFTTSRVSLIKTPQDATNFKNALITIGIIALIHTFAGIYTLYNSFEISRINKFFLLQTTMDNINTINVKEAQIEELNKYNELIDRANTALNKKSIVDDKIITAINNIIPHPIQFATFVITTETVTLKGVTPNAIHVAELQHNLNSLDFISGVQVSEIKEDEKFGSGYSSFLIECKLSGGVK